MAKQISKQEILNKYFCPVENTDKIIFLPPLNKVEQNSVIHYVRGDNHPIFYNANDIILNMVDTFNDKIRIEALIAKHNVNERNLYMNELLSFNKNI